jgi:3-oxoacyl-[acyl-carrier-protein] synthase III
MSNFAIVSTGAYLPEKCLTNDDLARTLPNTSDEWIFSHTGIRSRRIVSDDENASTMAVAASRKALERAGVAPEEIGTIILATATPDYGGFPATACVVQKELGAINSAAFDLTAGCSGFVYGLAVANGLGHSDDRPILLIGTEALSRIVDWNDYKTCVLFGDGAGAVVLKPVESDSEKPRGILGSYLRAKGAGTDALFREGGCRLPAEKRRLEEMGDFGQEGWPVIQMNGRAVFQFAVRAIEEVVVEILKKFELTIDDLRYIVPHQANSRIIQSSASRLGIDESRFFTNLERTANTSSASIPIALAEMDQRLLIEPGDLIMTVGFGAGLTYAGNLIRW